jgi:hypothetical protein
MNTNCTNWGKKWLRHITRYSAGIRLERLRKTTKTSVHAAGTSAKIIILVGKLRYSSPKRKKKISLAAF